VDVDFTIGEWLVSPRLNQISHDGESIRVEPKTMQVLVYLAEHPGVVAKDELISVVWPNVFVSDDVLPGSISALRKAFRDDARHPRFIETIHKRGYRLLKPVEFLGSVEPSAEPPGASLRKRLLSPLPLLAISAAFLIVLGVVVFAWASTKTRYDSIAVLPFSSGADNAPLQYLSDGLAEQVINDLSRLSNLRVMAWATVSHYRQPQLDALAVGRDLGVKVVLISRFNRDGDRITVRTELVEARGGALLWGQTYQRTIADVAGLQRELVRDVASHLRLHLDRIEESKLAHTYAASPEAYELYLKGRFFWSMRTKQSLQQAIDYFQQAIHIDPDDALAYAGLADCYNLLDDWGDTPPRDSFPRARAAAEKALSLDPSLAEAHVSLAMVRGSYDWDWGGAEQEFRRAIELNPSYPTAHQWYGLMLASLGRFSEAEAEVKRAQQLDPLSPITSMAVAEVYTWERHYDRSVGQYQKLLALNPRFAGAYGNIAQVYEHIHRYREASDALRQRWSLDGEAGFAQSIQQAYSRTGYSAVMQAQLQHLLERRARGNYVDPTAIAGLYAELGHESDAFQWIQRGYEEHSSEMQFLCVAPEFDSIRANPRFQYWLQVVGLSPVKIDSADKSG
jgi:DNA-binding winged helix-turn-helix (wHTH) protein/TolB-like protein/Tfp pilus assembly protein PilF